MAVNDDRPDPWEKIMFRGWKMSRYTAAAIANLEEKLGYKLTLLQGPYNDDVGGSAGTHKLDGVIDLSGYDAARKCRVARENGWAMWIRPENWDGKGGKKHLHGVLKSPLDVDELAEWQRDVAYARHWDGLSGNNRDDFPHHPVLQRFSYVEWWREGRLEQRLYGVNARIKSLRDKLETARAKRARIKANLAEL